MKTSYHRRNYFINKDFQGRYIFSYFLFVIIGSIIFIVILGLFSADTMTMVYDHHDLQLGSTPAILMKQFVRAHWLFVVGGGLMVIIASIFITHRIAGPLYRLEKSLDEMIKGNISINTTLRQKDEGQELARKMNQFNEVLSLRLKELNEAVRELDAVIQRLVTALPAENTSNAVTNEIQQLRTLHKRLNKSLKYFALKNE